MKTGELIYSLDELDGAVDLLYPMLEKTQIITFTGSLGAGKTTLIQALMRRAGVKGPIQSPTFSYFNVHISSLVPEIIHFDLYRLHDQEDFLAAGFDEYLYKKQSRVLIEWPGIILPLLTHDTCHVTIDYEGLSKRKLSFVCV